MFKHFQSFLLFLIGVLSYAQNEDAWIFFVDKPHAERMLRNPEILFTTHALERKNRLGIDINETDVPVYDEYINSIENEGLIVRARSKWMNAVHVQGSFEQIENVRSYPNVLRIEYANKSRSQSAKRHAPEIPYSFSRDILEYNYGSAILQMNMHEAHVLHEQGYRGENMRIAVIDNGFNGVDAIEGFASLRNRQGIVATYNFVTQQSNVYSEGSHGTMVLSTMAGLLDDVYIGTAPQAEYVLLVSESNAYESVLEESFWVEAAEYADYLGCDIINTSLGYANFDTPSYNYNYQDLNGSKSFITRGVEWASSKGLLCVTSAGNYGNASWQYITVPADAPSGLTVGAVNSAGQRVAFSSVGPTSDGRIKPDVMSLGQGVVVFNSSGNMVSTQGTSFSSPIIAGLTACLWQAFPSASANEIKSWIMQSSSNATTPNSIIGYGIPNFSNALSQGQLSEDDYDTMYWEVFPNPVSTTLSIKTKSYQPIVFTLYNSLGSLIFTKEIASSDSIDLSNISKGIYFYILQSDSATVQKKGKLIVQ